MKPCAPAICLLIASLSSHAAESEEPYFQPRFAAYEPSYAVYRKADNDENAITARYSFQYILWGKNKFGPCAYADRGCHYFYLSYTGEFDFYVGSRDSSPVINRVSNPAFHWRHMRDGKYWIDVGVEHRSNGQSTEITSPEDAARAQEAYLKRDHAYFDGISRGSNYVSVQGGNSPKESTHANVKLKFYFSKDSAITWGPWVNRNTSIADYDLARFYVEQHLPAAFGKGSVGVEWIVGKRGLQTDSANIDLLLSQVVPLYIRVHRGPLRTLSDYTRPQNSIGIGLKFSN
ncbi:hypothetical protein ACEN9F_19670 [Duganella sp. CT11-25]|jgi:hypothetical protein|uniref:hypothetical protein n=1 Tax=unclassified Duganella TaxID=2636909 RepID=UPI0039B03D09